MSRVLLFCSFLLLSLSEGLGQSTITTIIGANPPPDGGPATQSIRPRSFVSKSANEFLIVDTDAFLWKLDGTGNLTRILGSGVLGLDDPNDDPLTADLSLFAPVAISPGGEIFFVDNSQIKKISSATGKIVLVAGTTFGFSGDNGPATQAQFGAPDEIKFGPDGNLYICDEDNYRIRKVDLTTQTVTTVAGNGNGSYNGDNIPATSAAIWPMGITFDLSGNLIVADTYRIRKIAGGNITTLAGNGNAVSSGDGGLATAASVISSIGTDIFCDANGHLYFSEPASIRKISASTGIITRYAGTGTSGYSGDGGLATAAMISPSHLSLGIDGNLYVTQNSHFVVRKITVGTGIITTIAGNGKGGYYGGDGPFTPNTVITEPWGMAFDANNIMYVASAALDRIFRLDLSTNQITTVVGTGARGFSGDNGLATQATLNNPLSVALDAPGNLYIADQGNFRIRKVAVGTGIITTIAGTGVPFGSFNGDNIPATTANISPIFVLFDNSGRLTFSTSGPAPRIRRIDFSTGLVSTIVGNGTTGSSTDGALAINSPLNTTRSMDYTPDNQLYFAETFGMVIRKVDMTTGVVSRVAGTPDLLGFSGDGESALIAKLNVPASVLVKDDGDILIADTFNDRIRRIDQDGIITTVAGTGRRGYDSDGDGEAHALSIPRILAVDNNGKIFFSETNGNKIRRLELFDFITGLDEGHVQEEDVRVYPVPVRTNLTVSAKKQEIETVRILTIAGSPLADVQVHGHNATLDFQGYPVGIYLVRVEQKNKVTIRKVVHVDR